MASGASRRKAKRASAAMLAEVERLNNLRRMAEQDPVREGEAFPIGRAKARRHFAKRGADAIGMHATVGKADSHDGACHGDVDRVRYYATMRASDMPRTRVSDSPAAARTRAELKANPLGPGPRLKLG